MMKKNIFNIDNRDGANNQEDDFYEEMARIRDSCFSTNKSHDNFYLIDPNYVITKDTMYCPVTFDGRMCWNSIPAGATAVQQCPEYLVGPGVDINVTKRCLEDGYWYTKIGQMRPWASYMECFVEDDEEFDTLIKDIFITGALTSLICLVMTTFMMFLFRYVERSRCKLYYSLLAALFIDDFFFVAWYNMVVLNSEVRMDNMILARPHIIGKSLCFFGWLSTTLLIAIYSAKRIKDGQNYPQWMAPTGQHWGYTMPIILTIYVTFFMMIHFTAVVAAKFIGPPSESYIVDFLYVIKAPLVLVPLCGVHFLLVPFNPPETNILSKYWKVFKSMVFSFLRICLTFLLYNGLTIAMRHRMTRYRRFYYVYPTEGIIDYGFPEREHIN